MMAGGRFEVTGKHPMDAMLDLALDEELRTEFSTDPTSGTDPRAVAEILNHPYIHPSRTAAPIFAT
jgi:hypothetical protein